MIFYGALLGYLLSTPYGGYILGYGSARVCLAASFFFLSFCLFVVDATARAACWRVGDSCTLDSSEREKSRYRKTRHYNGLASGVGKKR